MSTGSVSIIEGASVARERGRGGRGRGVHGLGRVEWSRREDVGDRGGESGWLQISATGGRRGLFIFALDDGRHRIGLEHGDRDQGSRLSSSAAERAQSPRFRCVGAARYPCPDPDAVLPPTCN